MAGGSLEDEDEEAAAEEEDEEEEEGASESEEKKLASVAGILSKRGVLVQVTSGVLGRDYEATFFCPPSVKQDKGLEGVTFVGGRGGGGKEGLQVFTNICVYVY